MTDREQFKAIRDAAVDKWWEASRYDCDTDRGSFAEGFEAGWQAARAVERSEPSEARAPAQPEKHKILCHAEGDKCHGCDHYKGLLPECIYAPAQPAGNASAEQQARDMLERIGVENAQSFTAGELVELANLIASKAQPAGERVLLERIAGSNFWEQSVHTVPPRNAPSYKEYAWATIERINQPDDMLGKTK